jgi:hypothetical protein
MLIYFKRWGITAKILRNSITVECKDYRGENWQGYYRDLARLSSPGLGPSMNGVE